jgi:hypothetical protein
MYENKLAESIKDFGNFWDQYRSDIVLRIEAILTEPVCPVAIIEFELDRAPFKQISCCVGNTIEEAIHLATDRAIERLAQFKGMTYPEIKAKVEQENEEERIQHEAEMLALRELYGKIKNTPHEFDIAELFDDKGEE